MPSNEQESKLKAARMHLYVRRGGPNYQTGLARMRTLGEELGVPIEVCNEVSSITYKQAEICFAKIKKLGEKTSIHQSHLSLQVIYMDS